MINRPQPDEYSEYASRYVSLVGDEPITDLLASLQKSTYDFFINLDPAKADYAYSEGKWTIKQVLGHMCDTERVFTYRALAFSRESITLPGFDQDVYMEGTTFNERSFESLVDEFKTIRQASLYLFNSFTEEQSIKKGIASGSPFSVRAYAYMTAGHELHHLNILRERYLV